MTKNEHYAEELKFIPIAERVIIKGDKEILEGFNESFYQFKSKIKT